MPENNDALKIDKINAGRDAIVAETIVVKEQARSPKHLCYIFLSCEHTDACDICKPFNETFCCYKKRIEAQLQQQNKEVTFINSQEIPDLKNAKGMMENLNGNCLLVVNSHKPVSPITYFQLGYAVAKGINIIGLNDGKNEMVLPENIKDFISITKDMNNFMKFVGINLMQLKGIELYENWKGSGNMFVGNSNGDRAFFCAD